MLKNKNKNKNVTLFEKKQPIIFDKKISSEKNVFDIIKNALYKKRNKSFFNNFLWEIHKQIENWSENFINEAKKDPIKFHTLFAIIVFFFFLFSFCIFLIIETFF